MKRMIVYKLSLYQSENFSRELLGNIPTFRPHSISLCIVQKWEYHSGYHDNPMPSVIMKRFFSTVGDLRINDRCLKISRTFPENFPKNNAIK